jgi:membrane protein required for beta-lactamase induction
MTLISALLGLVADRLLTHLHEYRRYDHFLRYVDWMRERLNGPAWDHAGGVLLIVLPVWLGVGLLQNWVGEWLFGLAGLLFYIAVFVYCLGPRDLSADVDTYCEVCSTSDEDLRQRAAGRLLQGEQPPEDTAECSQRISSAVLSEANDRLFAVLFWFVLLGPLGAVMYRSASVLYSRRQDESDFTASVAWLYAVLLWLPARLVALGYALSGHFDSALEGWRQAHQHTPQGAEGSTYILVATGNGALGLEASSFAADPAEPVRSAMRLVWRTLTVWIVVLSLLVLAGWIG